MLSLFSKPNEGWIFVGVAVLAIAATSIGATIPAHIQTALLVSLVALLGLPHGCLDMELARENNFVRSSTSFVYFGLAYLALAGTALLFWIITPMLALGVFLVMSAYHFGGDWERETSLLSRWMLGGLVVSAPALFHIDAVAGVFSQLIAPEMADWFAHALQIAGFGCLAGSGLALSTLPSLRTRFEILAIIAASAALPPLLYFILYFCVLHSQRHLIGAIEKLRITSATEFAVKAGPILILTWVFALAAWRWMPEGQLTAQAVQLVFIGLFAVSVPHILLVDLHEKRNERGAARP